MDNFRNLRTEEVGSSSKNLINFVLYKKYIKLTVNGYTTLSYTVISPKSPQYLSTQ